MSQPPRNALLLGCHGGVARALLALLEHSAPGRRLSAQLDALFLVDREPPSHPVLLHGSTLLRPMTIASPEDLAGLVRALRISEVIDASSIDTVDSVRVCDRLGAHFLCTSVEEWAGQPSVPTDQAIARLLPPNRPALGERSHLIGAGANPGIVNALVFAGMDAFARRVGVAATPEALDLSGVLITEEDTTVDLGSPPSDEVFAMTWSPAHCLEELLEPSAFVARNGRIEHLGHAPTRAVYRARCGDAVIEGMAVPHEEIATLALRLPAVEIGFVYRIPEAAALPLARHPDRPPAAWRTRRLCPPWTEAIAGKDRIGVLLCSRRFGELWIGFETDVAMGLQYGTNATQLQVAAGMLAAWMQLGARSGVHFVEDLDWEAFVCVAQEVLGPPLVVHDPLAPSLSLAERRL